MAHRLEILGGTHIREALAQAVATAIEKGVEVVFEFNGREHHVYPTDTYEAAKARSEGVIGSPILTADEEAEQARRDMEETKARRAAAIAEAGVMTEEQMRDAEVPWLRTPEALAEYVKALVDRPHDYGTCVYAMSMAAVAAFHFVAGKLGATGFQASCADLDILRRTRGLKHGFRIVDYGNLLYPQYWTDETRAIFAKAIHDEPEAWANAAAELLNDSEYAVPGVRDHWRWIIEQAEGAKD